MNFQKKLDNLIKKNNSLVCVGLDSDIDKIPQHLKKFKYPLFKFNKAIIDKTFDLVCSYKPNSAFYEVLGDKGIKELKMTADYLHKKYPWIPIILDAKRADIGNTNNGYAKFAFQYLGVDAITIHPYLGVEAIKPFLEYKDKGIIILCRTSNKGAEEIQNLMIGKKPLYQIVAEKVVKDWNYNKNCLLVVGATSPKELQEIRQTAKEMIFLVPGVGAQGGDLRAVIKAGLDSRNQGMIISASRSIIFNSVKKDFAEKAREEAKRMQEEINYLKVRS